MRVGGSLTFLSSLLLLLLACAKIDGGAARSDSGATGGDSLDAQGRDPRGGADVGGSIDAPPVQPAGNCQNLCRQQVTCPGGGGTTISGVVHAPTPPKFGAADPLYNALVYVPNAPVAPFTAGVACQRCESASGSPLVKTLTGPDGKFTLTNAPAGTNIPLVIQIGRWRRQIVIPTVAACANTALPDDLTHLPRNKSEGDIPAIAIATGTFDPFDCTLRKIGIDEAEFTLPGGGGRVNVWAYGGHNLAIGAAPGGDQLMGSLPTLSRYDLLLLPCDDEGRKDKTLEDNLLTYAGRGGRVFLTDWSYSWLRSDPTWDATATWATPTVILGNDFTTLIDGTFPKGAAFSSWLSIVAAAPMATRLPIHDPYGGRSHVASVVPPTQQWLYTSDAPPTVQHLTFNTPVGVPEAQQCGRVVFSQFHVADEAGGTAIIPNPDTFPKDCSDTPMSPQEKALEFMLFDLSSCVQSDTRPPIP